MPAQLDHTIVHSRDRFAGARFLAELLTPMPADDLWLSDPWSQDEPQDGEA